MNIVRRLLLPAIVIACTVVVLPAGATTSAPPVLYLHGFIGSPGCPGIDTSKQAAPLASTLKADGYTGPVIGIDWLCGDKGGANIKPFGTQPASSYNAGIKIEDIAYAFAWYVWTTYSSKGLPVNVVGHSMGGLITSYAVKHAGTAGFPAYLLIDRVATFSTPYAGLDKNGNTMAVSCGSYMQCQEMTPGSAFLTNLARLTRPASTIWTTIGGSPADIMTYASSSATDANAKVEYYDKTTVNYGHSAYMTDTSQKEDIKLRINGAGIVGPHSLRMGWKALTSLS